MIVNIEQIKNDYQNQINQLDKRINNNTLVVLGSLQHNDEDAKCISGTCNHIKIAMGNIKVINYEVCKSELHEICKTGLLYIALMDSERCMSTLKKDIENKLKVM